ncbi:hypothetical protein ACHAXA_002671 [Cyclostephanos tholiformis]|uniref:FAD/NAD(P)-binding domain-containing protein n=1 Tax=Cyclostephanos tholiformis TaxID=382380 RepID=A0ABD3RZY9_9STRA
MMTIAATSLLLFCSPPSPSASAFLTHHRHRPTSSSSSSSTGFVVQSSSRRPSVIAAPSPSRRSTATTTLGASSSPGDDFDFGGGGGGGGTTEIVDCDVAIIGGGPAGCTCALYTSRSDLSTIIIDKNPGSGALAVTSHIANYPGVVDRGMSGMELLDAMRDQATRYGARYVRAQVYMIDVTSDDDDDDDVVGARAKVVYTPDLTVRARSLVLATGAMGRVGRTFPGESEYLGRGVSYCATCDGAFYRDSPVAVYGMSTEAIEEALYLTKFASVLYWITSSDVSMDDDDGGGGVERNRVMDRGLLKRLLERDNVHHMERTRLLEVLGDVGGVTGVRVKRPDVDDSEVINVEGAFVYGAGGGSKPITDFIQGKVDLDDNGGVIVDEDMKTSVDGVYAIGDIRNTDYKQVVVAASDGCIAAMSIEKFLNKRKMVKVDWIHR